MIGGNWTAEHKAAYRAAFTVGRIGDEVWLLIAIAWPVVCAMGLLHLSGGLYLLGAMTGYLAGYILSWEVILPWLVSTMPDELRAALPKDRFSGPSSLNAPRTYRELLRRWTARTDASGTGSAGRRTTG
jgi:hypothetical protein